MRAIMRSYPEVVTVVSQHGRPDDGTDATGFFNAEFFVPLKPFDTWPAGVDKDKLTEQMTQRCRSEFPGVDFNFSQYIEDNVEEAASGVKGENSVKLFGGDLETLEKTANKIKDVMATVPGITDLGVLRLARPADCADRHRSRHAPRATAWHRATSTPRCRPRSAARPRATCMRTGSDRNFPDHRPPGAGISTKPRCDPPHHHRRAEPERQRRRADPVVRCRDRCRQADLRRLVHLSRGAGALHPDQVQRARPRSRHRGAGGAEEGR